MTKSLLKSLELENQEMKSTIFVLNAELSDSKNMLEENHPLVILGTQLSKLKSINKRPSLLAADRFYDMSQAVMPKVLPEEISLGGGLIVYVLFASLLIKNNKIISGILNYIRSPSKIQYVVKKSREAIFMSILGFVCNYPCIVSCDKG